MTQKRDEIINALKEGCLNSKSEYVSVRREDLLTALGVTETSTSAAQQPAKEKKPA